MTGKGDASEARGFGRVANAILIRPFDAADIVDLDVVFVCRRAADIEHESQIFAFADRERNARPFQGIDFREFRFGHIAQGAEGVNTDAAFAAREVRTIITRSARRRHVETFGAETLRLFVFGIDELNRFRSAVNGRRVFFDVVCVDFGHEVRRINRVLGGEPSDGQNVDRCLFGFGEFDFFPFFEPAVGNDIEALFADFCIDCDACMGRIIANRQRFFGAIGRFEAFAFVQHATAALRVARLPIVFANDCVAVIFCAAIARNARIGRCCLVLFCEQAFLPGFAVFVFEAFARNVFAQMRRCVARRDRCVARISQFVGFRGFLHRAETVARHAFADKFAAVVFERRAHRADFPFFAFDVIANIAFGYADQIVDRDVGIVGSARFFVETEQYLDIRRFVRIGRDRKFIRFKGVGIVKIDFFDIGFLFNLIAFGIELAEAQIEIAVAERVDRAFVFGIAARERLLPDGDLIRFEAIDFFAAVRQPRSRLAMRRFGAFLNFAAHGVSIAHKRPAVGRASRPIFEAAVDDDVSFGFFARRCAPMRRHVARPFACAAFDAAAVAKSVITLDNAGNRTKLIRFVPRFAFAQAIFARMRREIAIFGISNVGFAVAVAHAIAVRHGNAFARRFVEFFRRIARLAVAYRRLRFAFAGLRVARFARLARNVFAFVFVRLPFAFAGLGVARFAGFARNVFAFVFGRLRFAFAGLRVARFIGPARNVCAFVRNGLRFAFSGFGVARLTFFARDVFALVGVFAQPRLFVANRTGRACHVLT